MGKYSINNVDATNNTNTARPYFGYGVHVAKILRFELFETRNGNPGMNIVHVMEAPEGFEHPKGYPGPASTTTMYLTEAAFNNPGAPIDTARRLVTIATVLGVEDNFRNLLENATSPQEVVNACNECLTNIEARWAFGAEEVEGRDGKSNWLSTRLLAFNCVESLEVSEEDSRLNVDANNDNHVKMLPVISDDTEAMEASESVPEDWTSSS